MLRFVFGLAVAMFAIAATAQAAGTASLPNFTSAEIRLTIWNGETEEFHLWRLYPGGRATGFSSAHYNRSMGYWHEEITDSGQWTLSGDSLCLTWRRLLEGGRHCYRLSVQKGTRLSAASVDGGRTSRGTIHPLAAKYLRAPNR
jgi:hypothetical protein